MNHPARTILLSILVLILVVGGSFLGGQEYQKRKDNNTVAAAQKITAQAARPAILDPTLAIISGTVQQKWTQTFSLLLSNGKSIYVGVSNATSFQTITKQSFATLVPGQNVAITGTYSAQGNVKSQNINITPAATK